MTTIDYMKAKGFLMNACDATGLPPAELLGVLQDVVSETRKNLEYDLANQVFQLAEENERLKEMVHKPETE